MLGALGILSASGASTFAKWSTTNKATGIALSNGNLTFTGSAGFGGTCISNIGKSFGKWYWEINVDHILTPPTGSAPLEYIGIATAFSNSSRVGVYANSIGYRRNAGATSYCFLVGGVTSGSGCTTDIATGNVLSFALDMDNKTLQFYIDGLQVGATLSIGTGTWFACCSADGSVDSGTANFGASAFSATAAIVSLRATLVLAGYNLGLF